MKNNNLNPLYDKKVNILYPLVRINGQSELLFYNHPYIGLADVVFSPGGVLVGTVNFDDEEEVNVRVHRGIPDYDSVSTNNFLASGIIAVGDKGLELLAGTTKEALFPWPSGLTDVLVVLDSQEVIKKQVRNITFYAEPYKAKVRKRFLGLFLRSEKD